MSEIKEDIIEQVNKLKEKGTENPTVDSFLQKTTEGDRTCDNNVYTFQKSISA